MISKGKQLKELIHAPKILVTPGVYDGYSARLVQKFGFDPVWFGVMFLICMQLGLLLPPHGLLLMTMKGVAPPQVRMGHIFQGVLPYIVMSLIVLALVFFVPAVAVWLPKVLV